jgi:hypothetical protein
MSALPLWWQHNANAAYSFHLVNRRKLAAGRSNGDLIQQQRSLLPKIAKPGHFDCAEQKIVM